MTKQFSITEHNIIKLLFLQKNFTFNEKRYSVVFAGKPVTRTGEPKTDVFLLAESNDNSKDKLSFKISFKQPNHDFVENKITSDRAKEIFGSNWNTFLKKALLDLVDNFNERKLIYKKGYGNTEPGSFTLGWRIELVNKENGKLSTKIRLTKSQVAGVYSGKNLSCSKKDAIVEGKIIPNSGVADYILIGESFDNIEDMLSQLQPIDEYVNENPDIYLVCKALNYRSFNDEIEGDRSLGVYVKWTVKNNKLSGKLIFDTPLEKSGYEVLSELKYCLNKLGIKNTNDIDETNTAKYSSIVLN